MSVFDYLAVQLSIIMGLGVTHILTGLSKTIHYRRTLRLFWVHTLWAFNILAYIVIIWWGMFWWFTQQQWSFFLFLLLILYAIVLFLSASLLFPWDLPQDFDFEAHFFATRPWFFAILAIAWGIDIPETFLKAEGGLRALPSGYLAFVIIQVTLALVGVVTSNRRFHRTFAVLWPLYTLGYVSITTLAEIAA